MHTDRSPVHPEVDHARLKPTRSSEMPVKLSIFRASLCAIATISAGMIAGRARGAPPVSEVTAADAGAGAASASVPGEPVSPPQLDVGGPSPVSSKMKCPKRSKRRNATVAAAMPDALKSMANDLKRAGWCEKKGVGIVGPWVVEHSDGRVEVGAYKAQVSPRQDGVGVRDGQWQQTGDGLVIEAGYHGGQLHGLVRQWKSTTDSLLPDATTNYVYGREHGHHYEFDEKGNLVREIEFYYGVGEGPWRKWRADGTQESWAYYRQNKRCALIEWDSDGKETRRDVDKECMANPAPLMGEIELLVRGPSTYSWPEDVPVSERQLKTVRSCEQGDESACVRTAELMLQAAVDNWRFAVAAAEIVGPVCMAGSVGPNACKRLEAAENVANRQAYWEITQERESKSDLWNKRGIDFFACLESGISARACRLASGTGVSPKCAACAIACPTLEADNEEEVASCMAKCGCPRS